jgi:phosphatidylinositol alpha 1,6-mannosyltransferase
MRILFCTDTFPPQVNGVSVVTALTVRGLQARGWTCGVVAPAYPDAGAPTIVDVRDVEVTSVPSVRWPPYPEIRLALPARQRVRRAVETFRPDLVHCATEFVIGRLGKQEAQRAGIPFCTSYHTDFAKYTEAYGVPWLRQPVTRWIGRFHTGAERIFTPSAAAREDLRRIGLRQIEVWGRGVDDVAFHPDRRSLAVRQGLDVGHAFTFLHVGRLAPEKNVELLLRAFEALRASLPPGRVRLVVAGSGPSVPALRAAAGPGVTFLGTLDRDRELPGLYASADAFLFASETETLGLVVLEAMASGLPVVAVPAGGVAEHLRDGENGLAYPAGDVAACAAAMRRLVEDHALREQLRLGARATAETRSWSAELDCLDASYRELLTQQRAVA